MAGSIDGLVSGLNTTDIISQMMSLERQPVVRLQTQQAGFDAEVSAWNDLAAKSLSLRTTAGAISDNGKLNLLTASSTDTSILTASASTSANVGSITLRVLALASAHQLTSSGFASATSSVGSGTATIASGLSTIGATNVRAGATLATGAHTLKVTAVSGTTATVNLDGVDTNLTNVNPNGTITVNGANGSTLDITVGASGLVLGTSSFEVARTTNGTLTDLATAISGGGGPASAQVINTGTGATPYQLVVTASSTGVANSLTVDLNGFTGLSSLSTLKAASDAQVQMGNLTISRASNTITDLVPGVTLNLAKADNTKDVVVAIARDVDGVDAKIKGFVDSLNTLLGSLNSYTSYDATLKRAGVLMSDSSARSWGSDIRNNMQINLSSGTYRSLADVGIMIGTNGQYTLDETKLKAALNKDYDSVVRLFSKSATAISDSRVSYVNSTEDTRMGTYEVQITQAASQGSATSATVRAQGLQFSEQIYVKVGGTEVSYTAPAGATASTIVAGLNTMLQNAKFAVTASLSGTQVVLSTTAYGSGATFDVKSTSGGGGGSQNMFGTTYSTHTGTNVVGSMRKQGDTTWVAATGDGQNLTGTTGYDWAGLKLSISATAAQVSAAGGTLGLGTVSYVGGVTTRMQRIMDAANNVNGVITNAKAGASAQSTELGKRIVDYNQRLTLTESRYKQQFANLETMLGQLRAQSSRLGAQIAGLPAA